MFCAGGDHLTAQQFEHLLQRLRDPAFRNDETVWSQISATLSSYRLSKFHPLMTHWIDRGVVVRRVPDRLAAASRRVTRHTVVACFGALSRSVPSFARVRYAGSPGPSTSSICPRAGSAIDLEGAPGVARTLREDRSVARQRSPRAPREPTRDRIGATHALMRTPYAGRRVGSHPVEERISDLAQLSIEEALAALPLWRMRSACHN